MCRVADQANACHRGQMTGHLEHEEACLLDAALMLQYGPLPVAEASDIQPESH